MRNIREKIRAYGAAICAAVLMGSLGIFVRNVSADPSLIAFARLGLGFVFLVGFLVVTGRLRAVKVSISPYLVASGVSISLCVWSYIEAVEHTSLGRAFYQLLWATLSLIPVLSGNKMTAPLQDIPWLIAVGFFQGFLALTLMIFALRHLTTVEYGILSYLEPVTATLIGMAIYAEPIAPLQALGGSLIIFSGLAQIWVVRMGRIQAA